MADIRINALATTAASTASDDFVAVDGSANGTRKLNAYSPTFGGNLTVSGTGTSSFAGPLKLTYGTNLTGTDIGLFATSGGGLYINAPTTKNIRLGFNLGDRLTLDENTATFATNLTVSGTGTSSVGGAFNIGANCYVPNANYYRGKNAAGSSDYRLIGVTSGNVVSIDPDAAGATLGGNLTVSGGTATISTALAAGTQTINLSGGASTNGSIIANGTTGELRTSFGPSVAWGGFHTWYTDTTERMRLAANGNFLVGTTTDSGNGKVQLATHTTSAGGIGFGTDTSLYREVAGTLSLNHSAGDPSFHFYNTGVVQGKIQFASSNFYITASAGSLILRTGGTTTALTLDSSQNATFAGKITANGAGSTFKGTATNDSAAAGYVGEFVSSIIASGSAVSLTTNTITNVTSISLTAGDWDVFGAVDFIPEATTVRTRSIGGVSTTSASLPATYYRNTLTLGTTDANAETYGGPTPVQRISISSTTTVYLVAFATFSGGTQTAHGYIQARRVR